MISVIIYGRNDQHGYNLHKRVAICLNSLAEVLTESGDEILFVDYNTPDDFPTLIEAISDTLTERCLRMLRVFRVRPWVHEARFRRRTHLLAVETVSRNVALRRSNPENRWILSTNGDVVVVPRVPGRSLSAIAAAAADGFYQLPRFEIPETLWESLDRRNPAAVLDRVRAWGTALRLNELVHTDSISRFDGIGDFQLCLRRDLFHIHGFNEAMLVGWNVDMNLCRRLSLLYGPPGTLLDDVFVYHCDHTRQPTVNLTGDIPMNDPLAFIGGVRRPELPEQAETWGLADLDIEEWRGDDLPTARFVASLERVIEPMEVPYLQGWNDGSAYTRLDCPAEHVLPYFADHLATLPTNADVSLVPGSLRMLTLFAQAWAALGGRGRVLVPQSLLDGLAANRLPDNVLGVALEEMWERAGLFAFEFALDPDSAPAVPDVGFAGVDAAGRARLGLVKAAFVKLAAWERGRTPCSPGRKFVCANAINTYFGSLARDELVFTWTPYNNRVCFGYVRPERRVPAVRTPQEQAGGLPWFLADRLGRRLRLDFHEAVLVRNDVQALLTLADPEDLDPMRCIEPLEVALQWPDLPAETGVSAPTLVRLAAVVRAKRASVRLGPALARPVVLALRDDAEPPFGKLASLDDWECPQWFAWAERFTQDSLPYISSTYAYHKRSRGVWERVQMLYALDRLGLVEWNVDAAVLCAGPEGLPLFLGDRLAHVDVVAVRAGLDRAALLSKKRWFGADGVGVHTGGLGAMDPGGRRWRFVAAPQGALFRNDTVATLDLLAAIDRHLEPGGVLVFSAEVVLTAGAVAGALAPGRMRALEHAVGVATGFRTVASFDWTVTPSTLDRIARTGAEGDLSRPHFVRATGEDLHLNGVWLWRKEHDTPAEAWGDVLSLLAGDGTADWQK